MSELSKQALKVENNTSFPNNNNGQITPSDLRAFNVDMIDSTVNQTQYTSDSASWNQQIDALEQFTSSQQPSFNQLNAFTASQLVINTGVNSFTQSANGRLTALESETANLEAWTASVNEIADGGIVQGTSTRLHFAGLVSASIVPNVNGPIASILIEQDPSKVGTASFNAFTQSTNISINALNAFTSSVTPTSTGSLLVTASFNNGTRNLTFTKGDASTFAVNIPDASGSAGDFVTTASFNSYTQSNDVAVDALESSASLALTTASFAAGTLTFTKGNGTTFGVVIPDISGSTINTGSFATTGSNTFYGDQLISGNILPLVNGQGDLGNDTFKWNKIVVNGELKGSSLNTTGRASVGTIRMNDETFPLSFISDREIVADGTGVNTHIYYGTSSVDVNGLREFVYVQSGSNADFTAVSASFDTRINNITGSGGSINTGSFATTGSNSFIGNQNVDGRVIISGSSVLTNNNYLLFTRAGGGDIFRVGVSDNGNTYDFAVTGSTNQQLWLIDNQGGTFINNFTAPIIASNNVRLDGGFTASLQEGYAWVGNATNKNTQVPTSSFGGGGSINTGSFATTGSNTFTGIQTFQDAALNATSLVSTSGSLMLVAKTFTSASSHLTASANSFVNLIFKANNLTGDTIISGSGNIIVNPNAAAAGFKRYLTSNNWFTTALPAISASMAWSPNVAGNIGAMTINMRGPVSASLSNIASNMGAGTINIGQSAALNAEKLTNGWNVNNNQLAGNVNISATQTALTGSDNTGITNNLVAGVFTFQISSSAIAFTNNQGGGTIINNSHFSGSAGLGRVTVSANSFSGTGNTIRFTGSMAGTYTAQGRPTFGESILNGASNEIVIDSVAGKNAIYDSLISGEYLIISASSPSVITDAGVYSTTMIGRYNANDGVRNGTSQNIFVVGTGISGSRKTGFLIDSGSNAYFEGNHFISGSTTLSGSLYIQSGSTLPVSTGSAILTWDATTGQVKQAGFSTIVSASVSSAEFWSTITESGSAGVSGSIQFNNSGSVYGVSLVNGTQLTVANAGVYNIQFSAQIETSAGADTMYMWFKKNGTNIGDSASKAVLANNTAQIMTVNILDQANANDYYEIAYQTLNGNATVLAEAASGNIPAIPSVIATVFQIR